MLPFQRAETAVLKAPDVLLHPRIENGSQAPGREAIVFQVLKTEEADTTVVKSPLPCKINILSK